MFQIFLVEDNSRIAASLTDMLHTLDGVEVVCCMASESEAIDWLTVNHSSWDLSIIDLALEVGNGFRILSAFRVRKSNKKMIVLSNHLDREMKSCCLTLGADAIFHKTVDIDNLLEFCRKLSAPK